MYSHDYLVRKTESKVIFFYTAQLYYSEECAGIIEMIPIELINEIFYLYIHLFKHRDNHMNGKPP